MGGGYPGVRSGTPAGPRLVTTTVRGRDHAEDAGVRVDARGTPDGGGAMSDPGAGRAGLAVVGGGKMGEALLAGLVRRRGRRRGRRLRAPSRAGRELTRATACRCVDLAEAAARSRVLLLAVKPQDVDTLLALLAGTSTTGTWSSPSPPASRPRGSRPPCRPGSPVVRVMPNTPALVGRGHERALGRRARRGGAPGRGRGPAGRRRPGAPGAGGPAGRGDRAVGQRPRLLLLPRRGDGRRRDPARPAPGPGGGPHRADRAGRGGDAARHRASTRSSCARR